MSVDDPTGRTPGIAPRVIVDCHTHLSKHHHEAQSFESIRDSLLGSMAEQGIGCSLVYPDSEPGTTVADLETTLEAIDGRPGLRMLGTVSLPSPDPVVLKKLDQLASAGKILGIKLYPGFELFFPDQPDSYPVYELCLKHSLAVVFHSGESMQEAWREEYNDPRRIARVAGMFPELRVVIAHFSQPRLADCRDAVVSNANVYADISGLAYPEVEERCGKAAIRGIVENVALQHPGKILFGTDWPICDVRDHIALVESLRVSDTTKARILSENADAVFHLRLRGPSA